MKYSVLVISILATSFLVIIVFIVGIGGITNSTDMLFGPYNYPIYSSFSVNTKGPNYFFPDAEVSGCITTPYAKYAENFTVYASVNNSTWVQVPFSTTPNNFKNRNSSSEWI